MIVGTAGHVDHGKSALVRALTGIDPDRLAEEKRRGITIDLGFAYMPLTDGEIVGFVDVPGHEHFLHNMLAGATGIDFVLLAVAADDGVMPQTIEHLAIVDLLGVTHGLVALTKCDLVGAERRAQVKAEIAALLAGTGLAGATIVETSAATGTGIDVVRAELTAVARSEHAYDACGRFRLAVDRRFTLRGIGTVVTGIMLSGSVAVGDTVLVSPAGLTARVRSLHAQNRPTERGVAGERCALNLAGESIAKETIVRGAMILDPTLHAPTQRIDVHLRVLTSETEAIGAWLPVRLHHGASEIGARVVPLDPSSLQPGGEGWAQLVLERPIAAAAGDRFVFRDTSARRTIGGGRFIDLRAPARRRRSAERLQQLAAMAMADPRDAIVALLALPPYHLDLTAFLRDRALPADHGGDLDLVRLSVHGAIHVLSPATWSSFEKALGAALVAFHAAQPGDTGAPVDALRRTVEPPLPATLFAAALAEAARRERIVVTGGVVRLRQHESRLSTQQEEQWRRIKNTIGDSERFRPPRVPALAQRLGVSEAATRQAMKAFAHHGLVEEVAPDHFFLRTAVAEAAGVAAELAQTSDNGQFAAAALRDRLDTGRKNAIELLEFFDRRGVTQRRGDLRRVDPRKLILWR